MGGRGIDTWLCVWCVCYIHMYLSTLCTRILCIGVMQIGTQVHHAFVIHALQLPVASCQLQKEKSEKGKLYAV